MKLGDYLSKGVLRLFGEWMPKLHYLPEKSLITANGGKMLVYPKKGGVHSDLFLNRIREPCATSYLLSSDFLKKREVTLDIGANIGYYALLELMIVGTEGFVYAIEPVDENYGLLTLNLKLNGATNFECFQYLIGERRQLSAIYVADHRNLSSIDPKAILESGRRIIKKESRTMLSVDDFSDMISRRIDFVRMDVEGYEYQILKGMQKTLTAGSPSVMVELHPHILGWKRINKFLAVFEENGYTVPFAVWERKKLGGRLVQKLSGLPALGHNLSYSLLKEGIKQKYGWCPNVFFSID